MSVNRPMNALLILSFKGGQQWLNTTMACRRKKIDQYFDDLEDVYFNMRQRDTLASG